MESSNQTKSGRVRQPTKRYLSYVEANAGRPKRQKTAISVSRSSAPPPKIDTPGKSAANVQLPMEQQHNVTSLPHPNLDRAVNSNASLSKDQHGVSSSREYVCRHCKLSVFCSSPQEFIKLHHSNDENKECYEKGLVHCPNKACKKKVFLTEKDLERHATMKLSSKTNECLRCYRDFKAKQTINMKHTTTQVPFQSMSSSMEQIPKDKEAALLGFGTLLNEESIPVPPSSQFVRGSTYFRQQERHQFTSSSHYHNILMSQHGVYREYNDEQPKSVQSKYPLLSSPASKKTLQMMSQEDAKMSSNVHPLSENSSLFADDGSQDFIVDLDYGHQCNLNIHVERLVHIRDNLDHAQSYWNSTFTREDRACVELEDILRKADSPLYLYDVIMRWAFINKQSIPSNVPPITRNSLYGQMSRKIYGQNSEMMKPRDIQTTLPSGRRCAVTVFNVYSNIAQLLSNESINNWSNYFFSPTEENPFHLSIFSDWESSTFDGIETSLWYKRTKDKFVADDMNEILVPICLFIDGTVLSLSGSLSLEPVLLSLMIHNRETRKSHEAWLPLGYINDPSNLVGRKYSNTAEKYTDYHHMLRLILRDLNDLVNSNDGLNWQFRNVPGSDSVITKKLIFKLAFIIGDTKGHDVLCCRMGSHNNTPGLCRDCDMTTNLADNPKIPCEFIKQKELALLPEEDLKLKSFFHVGTSAFEDLPFGASPYGINCATAVDVIHSILLGLVEYLYTTFTDQLTGSQWKELSNVVTFIASYCGSIPGFPRTDHFKKGLLKKGIMNAKMKLARCFLVFLALKTERFRLFLSNRKGKLPPALSRKLKKWRQQQQASEMEADNSVQAQHEQPIHEGSDSDSDSDAEESTTTSDRNVNDDQPSPNCSGSDNDEEQQCVMDDDSSSQGILDSEYCADVDNAFGDMEDDDSDFSEDSANDLQDDDGDTTSRFIDDTDSEGDDLYEPWEDYETMDPIVFTEEVYDKWTDLFESTLILYHWLTSEELPCIAFQHGSLSIAKHCLENFMIRYKDVAYRYEGMGLKLTKFHQLRHWYFYIAMYGVPTNFDSSFCESHHINLSKKTGRRTQKRQDELASQTAKRVYESILLRTAVKRCNFYKNVKPRGRKRRNRNDILLGSEFIITFDYSTIDDRYCNQQRMNRSSLNNLYDEEPSVVFRWKRRSNQQRRKGSPQIILQSIAKKLSWYNSSMSSRRIAQIQGSTEVQIPYSSDKTDRKFVRSHPDFRGTGLWLDWVDVCWESGDRDARPAMLPAQVLMILDFDSIEYEDIPQRLIDRFPSLSSVDDDIGEEYGEGIHVLVHSAADDGVRDIDPCNDSIVRRLEMEPFFQLVELSSVQRVCYVSRDPPEDNGNPMIYWISSVLHPQYWGYYFFPKFCSGYKVPERDSLHKDEFNEQYNPW